MRTTLFLFLVLSINMTLFAQKLQSCIDCGTKVYTSYDISKNQLFEIELLRNEIFARHHYSFKNQRLQEYFYTFEWFTPNKDITVANANLNAIEKENITLFLDREKEIKEERKLMMEELQKLKDAVSTSNDEFISSVFKGIIDKKNDSYYNAVVEALDIVFSVVNLDQIHWHKNKAKYELLIDDGFAIAKRGIYITDTSVTIIFSNPMQHSEIMQSEDAFQYPSQYYSESENTAGATFRYIDGKLVLVAPILAG